MVQQKETLVFKGQGDTVQRLLLIRHCQTSGQEPDAELTRTGLGQAQTLARFLADYPIDMIATSSYTRARQSIEPFAARVGLRVYADDRLVEQSLAPLPVENGRQVVRDSFANPEFRLPGGESGSDVLNRGWAALQDLLDGRHRLAIAVTHGKFLSTILNSLGPDFGYESWQSLSNPDVFALTENAEGSLGYERLWSELSEPEKHLTSPTQKFEKYLKCGRLEQSDEIQPCL